MRVATDIGGTFTDVVYIDDNNHFRVGKSNTTPPKFEEGVINSIENCSIDFKQIDTFIHGTTVIINAITERKGVKAGLITTKGFRDVLEIARGNRPHLFNILYKKPSPFIERYLRYEASERVNYKGEILIPLDLNDIDIAVNNFKKEGVEAIAIAFLHSYANIAHEKMASEHVKKLWPEIFVTCSHEITKEWREYERTNTAVINSYVQPIAAKYMDDLEKKLKNKKAKSVNYIMQSNGGVTTFEQGKITPVNMMESGPVAGVYGAKILGDLIGVKNIIALDVGGTTAKCSLIENGEVKVSTDYCIEKTNEYAGYPIKVPVVDIVEIGNGGGSIAWIDDAGSLNVGPRSAGSVPGPIAYNIGGEEPTTTDANLLTGRLSEKNFDFNVDLEKVSNIIYEKIAKPFNVSIEEAALGIIRIANSNMLNALKLISIRRGYDPTEFTLVAYGGGGSMHAMALAKELGIKRVVIPLASPVFSAWGMIMSDLRHDYVSTYVKKTDQINFEEIHNMWSDMERRAKKQFASENILDTKIAFQRFLNMRYSGQEHSVAVPVPLNKWASFEMKDIIQTFHNLHEKQYSFTLNDVVTEIVGMHLTAVGEVNKPIITPEFKTGSPDDAIIEKRKVYFEDDGWTLVPIYNRELIPTNVKLYGPLIVEEKAAVTVVYKDQFVYADEFSNLIIEMVVNKDAK